MNSEYFTTLMDIFRFFHDAQFREVLTLFKPELRPRPRKLFPNMTELEKKLNSMVIRDWFKTLIWKKRLEKASRSSYSNIYK